jgi:membrane protein
VAGSEVADLVSDLLDSALEAGNTAAVVGIGLLFWTSSSLFLEIQHDLNDIFDVPYDQASGVIALAWKRAIGVLWAFGLGLALAAVWLLNAVWRFLSGVLPEGFERFHDVIAVLAPLVSVLILPFLFGLIFQTMTVVKLRWRAVWWGGLFTGVVFVLAAYGIGVYFAIFEEGPSAIGFAGSLVVILFLAYLLSTVFLFGAEMTKAYSDRLDREPGPVGRRHPGSEPTTATPKAAIFAFLAGLLVGWRRSRR